MAPPPATAKAMDAVVTRRLFRKTGRNPFHPSRSAAAAVNPSHVIVAAIMTRREM
jgi:hypothetical protein